MNLSKQQTIEYFTMEDYCTIIKDYIIKFEHLNLLSPQFNPKKTILDALEDESCKGSEFITTIIWMVEKLGQILNRQMPKKFHIPKWVGKKNESLGRTTFKMSMIIVWPELLDEETKNTP